jgi:hypothetical protein
MMAPMGPLVLVCALFAGYMVALGYHVWKWK